MRKLRTFVHLFAIALFFAAIFQLASGARANEQVTNSTLPESPSELIKELEEKRVALEQKQYDLEERERLIKQREDELDKKIKDLERIRAEISGELEEQRRSNEERVAKLVVVFETMSPKSASSVLETLDDWLSVEVLKRMDPKRMAKIMNIMDKARSAKLSELLTGYFQPEESKSSEKATGQGK